MTITKQNNIALVNGMIQEYNSTTKSWIPTELESSSSISSTELSASDVSLIDETDFVIEESSPTITEGIGYDISVSSTTGTGEIIVYIYSDYYRGNLVYSMNIDLSDTDTYYSKEAFGFTCETDGTLYATVYTNGVEESNTIDITIDAIAIGSSTESEPLESPYGDGIEDDGEGNPRVALTATGGLEFDSSKLVIKPDVTKATTIALGSGGAYVSGAINNSTSESISAKKVFDSVGYIPLVSSGPPTTGTYYAGAEILDSNYVRWRCISAGTPGTWILADSVLDEPDDVFTSYPLEDTGSQILEISVTGNYGFIQQLQIWGIDIGSTDEMFVPFRARIYKNSDGYGKDVLWQGSGLARQTALTASLPASQTYLEVGSNDIIDVDEALVIYEDDDRYELARCSGRTSSNIDISEALEDDSSWASDTLVAPVTEWTQIPFSNNDGLSTNTIFLEIRHDGLSTDPSVLFYARLQVLSLG